MKTGVNVCLITFERTDIDERLALSVFILSVDAKIFSQVNHDKLMLILLVEMVQAYDPSMVGPPQIANL